MEYQIPELPLSIDLETKSVLKQLNAANRKLAELKGVALTIPNETILINTLALQEAKDSSAVEKISLQHTMTCIVQHQIRKALLFQQRPRKYFLMLKP
ncbi:MAG TPA: Fic/DOC family N-terminal domain-containing protein [Paludibacteraceae bacterium]|nr:Fic/DOC family N-terminal domain-containing protein [Paludibacteraceae bacterium]HPT43333.1 Fic/DOC family N-terminal domain-containing protein [Paludibacteraceae bacterium]